jgi:cytochrome c5
MNALRTVSVAAIALFAAASLAVAAHHTPEERGKTLFNDPKLGGGAAGRSCSSCHPDGKGLEKIAGKKEWRSPDGSVKSLEDMVNTCITMALKGNPLDVRSGQMQDLVSYLRTFKAKEGAAPKKKAPVGC